MAMRKEEAEGITRKEAEEQELDLKDYTECEPNVVNFFRDVAEENHTHLREARIAYLWRNKKWEKRGIPVPGVVKVVQPFMKPLLEFDFVIIINHKYWGQIVGSTRRALADHLLSFCGFKLDKQNNYIWCLDHPVGAEFAGVVRRHGRWNVDLEATENAWRERLVGEDGSKKEPSGKDDSTEE